MRWFIVELRVEKLQRFPNPWIPHTGANTNPGWIDVDLPKNVVDFAPRLILETHF
jgi:hypothetical protein